MHKFFKPRHPKSQISSWTALEDDADEFLSDDGTSDESETVRIDVEDSRRINREQLLAGSLPYLSSEAGNDVPIRNSAELNAMSKSDWQQTLATSSDAREVVAVDLAKALSDFFDSDSTDLQEATDEVRLTSTLQIFYIDDGDPIQEEIANLNLVIEQHQLKAITALRRLRQIPTKVYKATGWPKLVKVAQIAHWEPSDINHFSLLAAIRPFQNYDQGHPPRISHQNHGDRPPSYRI